MLDIISIVIISKVYSKVIISTVVVSCIAEVSGMYYKHITIANDDSSIVNNFEASFADAARVIIYDRHMFMVQDTGIFIIWSI
jgi:hypothetical protein